MNSDFTLTTSGYIQNAGEPHSNPAQIQLSGNPQHIPPGAETTFQKPAGDYIVLRMLDARKLGTGDHRISHIGLTLTRDEATSLTRWLSDTLSDAS